MKTIITTVGTSLFTNYMRHADKNGLESIKADFNELEEKSPRASEIDSSDYVDHCKNIRYCLNTHWVNSGKEDICAEVQSTLQFIKQNGESNADFKVHLIATDTVLSRLAAELIAVDLNQTHKISCVFNPTYTGDIVEGLIVKDKAENSETPDFFKKGLFNFVRKIEDIIQKEKSNENAVFLNISGGYKGFIPIATLVGQIRRLPIIYNYENSDSVLNIGSLPINFDWEVIEQYTLYLKKKNKLQEAKTKSPEIIAGMEDLYLVEKSSAETSEVKLSIVGELLATYLERESPFSGTIMGYFIEYKVAEYYGSLLGSRDKVEQGFEPKILKGKGDVDILLLPDELTFSTIEIKPVSKLSEDDFMIRQLPQNIIQRALETQKEINRTLTEVSLLTYSYASSENLTLTLTDEQKANIEQLCINLSSLIDVNESVLFKLRHFFITTNKIDGNVRHIYQKFMKSKMKPGVIKDIFSARLSDYKKGDESPESHN